MTTRQIVYAAVLVPFLSLTAYVLATAGMLGFYVEMLRSASTVLAGTDLVISLSLVLLWMSHDAQRSGTPFAPYAAITLALGVAGPLLYLIHREARVTARAAAPAQR